MSPMCRRDEGGDMNIALKPLSRAQAVRRPGRPTNCARKLRNIPGINVTFTNPPTIRIGGRWLALHLSIHPAGPGSGRTAGCLRPAGAGDAGRSRPLSASTAIRTRRSPSVQVDDRPRPRRRLGVTPTQIETALGSAFGGQQVSQIYATDRPVSGDAGTAAAISARRHRAVAALSAPAPAARWCR